MLPSRLWTCGPPPTGGRELRCGPHTGRPRASCRRCGLRRPAARGHRRCPDRCSCDNGTGLALPGSESPYPANRAGCPERPGSSLHGSRGQSEFSQATWRMAAIVTPRRPGEHAPPRRCARGRGPFTRAAFGQSRPGYVGDMDPASIFILIVLVVIAAVCAVFLFFTAAGVELREGRRERRRRRPEHTRVENEQNAVSSPARSSRSGAPPGPNR